MANQQVEMGIQLVETVAKAFNSDQCVCLRKVDKLCIVHCILCNKELS